MPLCHDRGWDPQRGGFHERLDPEGRPLPMEARRLVVQCRQIYVLSHAALEGERAAWETRAGDGLEWLRRHYWDDRHGGWHFSVAPDGTPHDRQKDCYGHAFVLLAMAYFYRAFQESDGLELAERTLDVLERRFAEAHFGGFLEGASDDWEPLPAPRRQNPHMHLLEGFLALHEATGEGHYAEHADRIIALFRERFFDDASGILREFYHDDWSPHEETGHLVEPGHHFEWTWLLHRYAQARERTDVLEPARQLYDWAVRHGIDRERGGVFDELDRSGAVLRDTKRMWPLTEAIKASGAVADGTRLEALLDHLFAERLFPDGRWREQLDRNGDDAVDYMPCSTPYHLFLGLSDAARSLKQANETVDGGTTL